MITFGVYFLTKCILLLSHIYCTFLFSLFREKIDVSTVADATIQILVYAQSLKSKVTALKLIDALLGKGPCKISSWKKPPANIPNKVSLPGVKSQCVP